MIAPSYRLVIAFLEFQSRFGLWTAEALRGALRPHPDCWSARAKRTGHRRGPLRLYSPSPRRHGIRRLGRLRVSPRRQNGRRLELVSALRRNRWPGTIEIRDRGVKRHEDRIYRPWDHGQAHGPEFAQRRP